MTAGTVLHIRSRDEPTARILELSGSSVRIGRGLGCEVRLEESALAEVQCLLRRRGLAWHVQPVGPPGLLSIEGRAVEHSRPLPLGVPLQVGETLLTLEPAEPAILENWGAYSPPVSSPFNVVSPISDEVPSEKRAEKNVPERARGESSVGAVHGTLEQREKRLRERLEQLRRPAGFRHDSLSKQVPRSEPLTPRLIEPAIGNVETQFAPFPSPTIFPPPATAPLEIATPGGLNPLEQLIADFKESLGLPEPTAPKIGERNAGEVLSFQSAFTNSSEQEPLANPSPSRLSAERPAMEIQWTIPEPTAIVARVEAHDPPPTAPSSRGFVLLDQDASPTRKSHQLASTSIESSIAYKPKRAEARFEPSRSLPKPAPFNEADAAVDRDKQVEEQADEVWPSAASIWEAHHARKSPNLPQPNRQAGSRSSPRLDEPNLLTIAQAPRAWTFNKTVFLIAWFFAFSTTATMALFFTALCWIWAKDDETAGRTLDKLSANGTELTVDEAAELVESTTISPNWWKTTADHLLYRAILVTRLGSAPTTGESTATLLDEARSISPAHPGVRLATAGFVRMRETLAGDPPPIETLGLSRDIVSLSFTAKSLLKSGRRDAAWGVAREAIDLALRADPKRLAPPIFLEDRRYRRLTLPHEGLLAPLFRDLFAIERPDLDHLATLLPETAVVRLAAARVLIEKEEVAAAQKAIDLTLAVAEPSPTDSRAVAEHLTARGEAFALRENWAEAAESYRRAIDLIVDDSARRAWSLNLADLLGRLGDDSGRKLALAAAKSNDSKDEITRRAAAAQRASGGEDRDPNVLRARLDPP